MSANMLRNGEALPEEIHTSTDDSVILLEEIYQEPDDTTVETFGGDFLSAVGGDVLEVAFIWSNQVLSVASYKDDISIGAEISSTFVLDSIEFSRPLVTFVNKQPIVALPPQATATFWLDHEAWTVEDLAGVGMAYKNGEGVWEIPMESRLRVVLSWDEYTFLIRLSDELHLGRHLHVDRDPMPYIGFSAMTHILALFLMMAMPENAGALELDGHAARDRFVQLALTPDEEVEEEMPEWLDGGGSPAADKHAGDEGAAGTESADATDKKMAIEGSNDPEDIELRKLRDREIASNAGAAGVFTAGVASLFGSAESSIGSDAIHALGALEGREFGDSKGVFGAFGIQGGMRGGGGHDEGSIGLTDLGLKGRSSGKCGHCDVKADLGETTGRVPGRVIPQPIASLTGGLDREIIKSVVRRHRREIKACYQAQLQKKKRLAGQITVKFTVSATGSVVMARTDKSSLNDKKVESCINNKIRRWVFPEPDGGGIVVVRYPFRFSSN